MRLPSTASLHALLAAGRGSRFAQLQTRIARTVFLADYYGDGKSGESENT